MKPSVGAIAPLVTAMIWTVALMVSAPTYTEGWNVFLICFGLLLNATVAVTGMVVVGGRWAYRLGWGVLGACALVAVVRPVDLWWWIGLGAVLVAALMMFSAASGIRRLPAATGPGDRAVLVTLTLLLVPLAIGLAGTEPGWAALVLGLAAPVLAFLYSRVIFGGLVGVRVVWPLLAIVVGFFIDYPGWILAGALAIGVAALAWHQSVKVAFHPPREVGSSFPIPPELAPTEVLDAARIDDRGRPQ